MREVHTLEKFYLNDLFVLKNALPLLHQLYSS